LYIGVLTAIGEDGSLLIPLDRRSIAFAVTLGALEELSIGFDKDLTPTADLEEGSILERQHGASSLRDRPGDLLVSELSGNACIGTEVLGEGDLAADLPIGAT
jgi:hypothetical protein